jgi:hypothetical protein
MIQHTSRWPSGPAAFFAFSAVFGANFNKFGVLDDLNDQMTQIKLRVLHGTCDKLQQVWRL